MDIRYIKADPSGNTTIFVLNPIAPAQRSTLAATLLSSDCIGAEQVGYLTMAQDEPIRVDMMGGEFCGNASRAAAAYALMCSGEKEGEYAVSCSGCNHVLQAHAVQRGTRTYDAYIEMPLPLSVEAILMDVGGLPSRFFRVALPGIVHFVHFVDDTALADTHVFWQAVQDYAADEPLEAYGLILFSPQQLQMIPAVYVTATDTLYWENSCGSGSAAVAAALACMGKKDASCTIHQPGGTIDIMAHVEDGQLRRIVIGGPVGFEAENVMTMD